MLSKKEKDYLSGKIDPSKNYEYKLLYSIRNKLSKFYQQEFPLIEPRLDQIQGKSSNLGKLTSYQTKLTPLTLLF